MRKYSNHNLYTFNNTYTKYLLFNYIPKNSRISNLVTIFTISHLNKIQFSHNSVFFTIEILGNLATPDFPNLRYRQSIRPLISELADEQIPTISIIMQPSSFESEAENYFRSVDSPQNPLSFLFSARRDKH